ncbi:MAG: hypothetical protein IJO91_11510 [Oscillospiraceae bacterium]|nr:hypothetical protein [Oscillospiraceae bacterium]
MVKYTIERKDINCKYYDNSVLTVIDDGNKNDESLKDDITVISQLLSKMFIDTKDKVINNKEQHKAVL